MAIFSGAVSHRLRKGFRQNKRGFVSFVILVILCVVSFLAEFIANDKPLFMVYEGKWHFPILKNCTQQDIGGDLSIECDFKDSEVQHTILASRGGLILWPLVTFNADTINTEKSAPSPPESPNFLGTDDQGRDVLARIIYGFRSSILFALGLSVLTLILGIGIGCIQGYMGGRVDLYLQRFIEIWNGIPVLYLLIILASLVEPNIGWLLTVIGVFSWVPLSQVVRAEVLRTRASDYVMAAKALGVPPTRLVLCHILPNAVVAALTYAPFIVNQGIVVLASLDFLGFGLPPGSPSLGELITQAKNNIHAPWLGICAFFVVSSLLTLLTFVGESVRDSFDPYKKIS